MAPTPRTTPRVDFDPALAHRQLRRLRWWVRLLDDQFRIPGTPIRFGLDPLMGLIPVAGDVIGLLAAGYVLWQAQRMGAPRALLFRMALNVAGDLLTGLVPVAGDLVDLAWRANRRNLQLIEAWLSEQARKGEGPVIDV